MLRLSHFTGPYLAFGWEQRKDCILCKIFWKTNGLELLVLWYSVKRLVGLLKRSQGVVKQFLIITYKLRSEYEYLLVWNGAFEKLKS